jgi:hypothetical protein
MSKMSKLQRVISCVIAVFGIVAFATPGLAQATRTWVSGVGDDANPCSRTAPCKTFAGAISKTAIGGEINVLDPGGFGGVTINKAITISAEGVEAGVLVAGTNAIVINAPAGDTVVLRGLDIYGTGTGLVGIKFNTGAALHVENCTIRDFNSASGIGIQFAPSTSALLFVSNTIVAHNKTNGIQIQAVGAISVRASLVRVQAVQNQSGIGISGTGGTGGGITVEIKDSVLAGNSNTGVVAATPAGGAQLNVMIDNTALTGNLTVGAQADGAAAAVRISQNTIMGNVTGLLQANGALLQSLGNNAVTGNGTDVTGTLSTILPK